MQRIGDGSLCCAGVFCGIFLFKGLPKSPFDLGNSFWRTRCFSFVVNSSAELEVGAILGAVVELGLGGEVPAIERSWVAVLGMLGPWH